MTTFKKYAFLWAYSFPLVLFVSLFLGGYWVFTGVLYAYVFIPILDEIVGKDADNISSEEEVQDLSQKKYFSFLVHSMVYLQLAIILLGAYVLLFYNLTAFQKIGVILSVGVFSSGGINIAHELGHKPKKISQWHSQLALMMSCYMHFFIEHNKGHHVHVATPKDPATSLKNQSVYAFWFQSVVGSFRSAWRIEKRRLARQNKKVWTLRNAMLWYIMLPIFFCILLTLSFGLFQENAFWTLPIYFFGQSIVAFLSLECVNYIEHYGIQRREIAPNRYERVNPLHSWNANHFISNLVLFQLQRHSDHHAYAARPYQVLRHFEESPQLPFGYPVMILMSLVPPLWFKVMNKRLESWKENAYNSEHIAEIVKLIA